ncbi:sodium:solute symporter (plasmid) [Mycolicibacterium arabiense]|uniref:Sodium:solute symporter n=1 Tax=Mycolicibacterium arabiense TaxID=1286181 RepID=A0A7I7RR48_9MYCO|nr:sodium:solute symporter family protein [Mycolicibacterium arabiense]MCV7371979.1 sodium:solute symporter family protein [Mycolicibacterium arabiense]BBY46700.1 sodium:solute symporter [Mycolicibacterium arabiense]
MIPTATIVGILALAAIGVAARRGTRGSNMAEWAVGGRRLGAVAIWFLQAGELFTTFAFLGLAGLAFTGGVAGLYAVVYGTVGNVVLFFLCGRLWTLGRERGYLTQGDFLEDRFTSRALGTTSAVLGVLFVMPYLQLQITGLGLVVALATGDSHAGSVSMILGTVLVVAFVLAAGIRGVAATSYAKDTAMVFALVLLVVAVPAHFAGGVSGIFHSLNALHPDRLSIHAGPNDRTWFITSVLVSAIGGACMTLPHAWPAVLSARDPKALRRNFSYIPLYSLCLLLPMIVGFAAILRLAPTSDSNGALLTLSRQVLPDWMTGVVVVAATATAMVPTAGILIAISTLTARNIIRVRGERAQLRTNYAVVVAACALALGLGSARPDLLANLLLLTYSGLVQLAPANMIGLTRVRLRVGSIPVLWGLAVGEIVVVWFTFVDTAVLGTFNVGLIGLLANLAVTSLATLIRRNPTSPSERRESVADPR